MPPSQEIADLIKEILTTTDPPTKVYLGLVSCGRWQEGEVSFSISMKNGSDFM